MMAKVTLSQEDYHHSGESIALRFEGIMKSDVYCGPCANFINEMFGRRGARTEGGLPGTKKLQDDGW